MSPGEETCPSGTGEESGDDVESRPPLTVEEMDRSCVGNGSMTADTSAASVSGISYVGMTDYIGMTDAEHIEMGIQNYRYRPGQWPHRKANMDGNVLQLPLRPWMRRLRSLPLVRLQLQLPGKRLLLVFDSVRLLLLPLHSRGSRQLLRCGAGLFILPRLSLQG